MEKKDFTKLKAFFKGNGFYIVLMVCVMAIGVTAWTALKPQFDFSLDNQQDISESTPVEQESSAFIVQNPQSNVPVESSSTPSRIKEEKSKAVDAAKAQSSQQSQDEKEYKFPCGNTILKEYADGGLVFSQTMQDWRTHDAVDFTASKGTPVTAMTSGKVTSVYEDLLLGWVVEVDHGDGYKALYCGLQKNIAVKKGQSVSAGSVIGGVGDIPCESTETEHFHFELYKDDKAVNPMDILGKKIERPALGNGRVE